MQTEHFKPPRCPYCGKGISINQTIQPGHCGDRDCATTHAVKGYHTLQKSRRDEYAQHLKAARAAPEMKDLMAMAGVVTLSDMALLTVPYQGRPLVPVPEDRMNEFKAHLSAVIQKGFEASDEEVSGYQTDRYVAQETPFLAAGCATCQGNCCKLGNKSKAFLSSDLVIGHRQMWPELTAEVMLENYIAALPDVATSDGCVYQGALGCTLPRVMRADICNKFHCHELEYSDAKANEETSRPIAIVGVDDDGIARNFATLTEEAGWQKM